MKLKKFLISKLKELLEVPNRGQIELLIERARLLEERQQIEAEKKSARETEIKTLFAAIGREYSEEKAKPYFDYSDEQFAFISADLAHNTRIIH